MRILVVSNLYPPHHIGGYELGCRDVVEELRQRGHAVNVLTSTFGVDGPCREVHVLRWLAFKGKVPKTAALKLVQTVRKERQNQHAFRRAVLEFEPDVVYLWNPVGISISLLAIAEQMGLPVRFFVSDHWLADWTPRRDRWSRISSLIEHRLPRRFGDAFRAGCRWMGIIPGVTDLAVAEAHFVSRFLHDRVAEIGRRIDLSRVIHWGIDLPAFPLKPTFRSSSSRLLYVGQVVPHKGPETAIEALQHLREHLGFPHATLDIVGGSTSTSYVGELHAKAKEMNLSAAIRFRGPVAREELPSVYHEHDVLVFPSPWDEPFSITLLEAMACGVPIVGTTTGGSGEILRDEHNALTFHPGDAWGCAEQIARLLRDADLYGRVRANARQSIEERYTLSAMVESIANRLEIAATRSAAI